MTSYMTFNAMIFILVWIIAIVAFMLLKGSKDGVNNNARVDNTGQAVAGA